MPTAPSPAGGAPPAAVSGPRLEITIGGLSGSFPLQREVVAIGRPDAPSGHRPEVDLGMDPAVSRRHAEIRHASTGYRIIDLGSTNGTVVNGQQIPRQQEVPLADGDEIRIGENCKLTLRL
jgi:pSer/pThr/pTyr-binding forkhead associated (FHA) protein